MDFHIVQVIMCRYILTICLFELINRNIGSVLLSISTIDIQLTGRKKKFTAKKKQAKRRKRIKIYIDVPTLSLKPIFCMGYSYVCG